MFKIGLSSKSNPFTPELFRGFVEAGIHTMEISNCSDGYDDIDFDNVKRLADEYGVTLRTFHLPFKIHNGVSHDVSNPELYQEAVDDLKRLIRAVVAKTGIKIFVLHPSGPKVPSEERHLWIEVCKRSLAELAEYADTFGAVIAVENMTHQCLGNTIAEFAELVYSHPKLRVCYDVNHLLHERPADFVERLGERIVHTHISDCNLEVEQHKLPGEGKIDFQEIIASLHKVGYNGPWVYEVSYKIPKPVDDKYKLTPASFVLNAEELFAGKTPSKQR